MSEMELKQIQIPVGGRLPKKQYQVFELNGMKLDYFDIELALHGISSEILRYQASVRENPKGINHKYDGMLHDAEEKFQFILRSMERPPENEERPAGIGINYPEGTRLV